VGVGGWRGPRARTAAPPSASTSETKNGVILGQLVEVCGGYARAAGPPRHRVPGQRPQRNAADGRAAQPAQHARQQVRAHLVVAVGHQQHRNLEVAVAAVTSPTGPRAAAKNGTGLLSLGATARAGFDALALQWDVMEQRGAEHGRPPERGRWRLVGPMHLAETREQAVEDVRYGLDDWADYTQHILAAPHFRATGSSFASAWRG
jgi:alkanesulfonate monooxygenase SsuD/methylene tetrahydromethanopterin reductase-like flavin-dependent oxidoreductase (luciferase family)